uniref:Pectin lyase-like superfamily protein n=1 Tax=Tanacetum cinerariifolium TaxID=118510 RepID=A0A699KPL9_TANCI|nr:pectin lyase-like superfamily protein [Tanacetum cinerariifolium]
MNEKVMNLEDGITPSIRKRLEILKEKQSHSKWFLGATWRGVTTMLVDEEEEKMIAAEKAIQEEFNEEAVRLTLEEEARYEKENQKKIREDEDSEYNQMCVAATKTTPRGKTIEADAAEPPKLKQQGRKKKVAEPSATEPPFRIYHKNRGRSEMIFNQKMKKTCFGPNGEGSTADKAFSL